MLVYGAGLVVSMSVCYLVRMSKAAPLSGLAVTIITLIPFDASPGAIALRRGIEVSFGVTCSVGCAAALAGIAQLRQRIRGVNPSS